MKKKDKKEKTFDTVKVFRELKEKIAKETDNMTFVKLESLNQIDQFDQNRYKKVFLNYFL